LPEETVPAKIASKVWFWGGVMALREAPLYYAYTVRQETDRQKYFFQALEQRHWSLAIKYHEPYPVEQNLNLLVSLTIQWDSDEG